MPNPQTSKIIIVNRTEMEADGRGSYLKVYDATGLTYRIPEKRSHLWDTFKNARVFEPILTTFETYRNATYIVNASLITEDKLKSAIQALGERIVDAQTEERNRSTALSYSKDLVVGDRLDIENLFDQAEKHYKFIKGEIK